MIEAFAQLDLEIIEANGTTKPYLVRVLSPVRDREDWHCAVQLGNPDQKLPKIYGVDSWQALILAMELVRVHLHALILKGNKLHQFGEEVDIATLFPRQFPA